MLLCVNMFRYLVGVEQISWFVHSCGFGSFEYCCGGVVFGVSGCFAVWWV